MSARWSPEEIAAATGRSVAAVRQRRSRYHYRDWSLQQIDKLVAMRQRGDTWEAIAARFRHRTPKSCESAYNATPDRW